MTYTPPTPDELRALLARWGLTGLAAGQQVDCNGRTVRRWTAGDREVSYAVLFTLAVKNDGVMVSRERWREELN